MLSLIDSLEIRNLVHFFWYTKKTVTNFHCNCLIFKWCHHESNEGHKDFQSFALPTELWHLFRLRVQR